MIYVMIRTYYEITPDSKAAVNQLIDFLELKADVKSPDMLYMPSKNVIKLRFFDVEVLRKLEEYVKEHYPHNLQWEVYDEDYYVVQYNSETDDMVAHYLTKLYPARHIWDL